MEDPLASAEAPLVASAALETGDDIALARSLLIRVAKGEPAALQPLYERFGGRALAIALRILRSREDAEEVLQETFLEVWRRAREYDPSRGPIEAWIAVIARTRAIDRIRSRTSLQRTKDQSPRADLLAAPPTPDQLASLQEDRARIALAFRQLPAEQRGVLELAFWEGLSQTEIAERIGQPLGTVKTRARLGMEKLAALLK